MWKINSHKRMYSHKKLGKYRTDKGPCFIAKFYSESKEKIFLIFPKMFLKINKRGILLNALWQ